MSKDRIIMKKIYMNPEMEVVEIKMTMGILAGSGVGDGDTPGDDYNSGDESYAPGLLFSIMN